jgi:hypothetical protein
VLSTHHDAKATYLWKGGIVTKGTYEERLAQQKSGEKEETRYSLSYDTL